MKTPQSENEQELLETLTDIVSMNCSIMDEGILKLDSMCNNTYTYAIRLLIDYGVLEIESETGRRIIVRYKK